MFMVTVSKPMIKRLKGKAYLDILSKRDKDHQRKKRNENYINLNNLKKKKELKQEL